VDRPRRAPNFKLQVEDGPGAGARVLKLSGELDSGTCATLAERFEQELNEPGVQALTLDLGELTFVDSTGTRAIIAIERAARGAGVSLQVIPPPQPVTELLRTAGVAERLPLAPEALEDVREAGFDERVELELERDPLSPGRARAEVRELLAERLSADELARAVLLTSELVTNAVVHPRQMPDAQIGVRITVHSRGIRVEVEDAGEGFELPLSVIPGEQGGRGLFLVDSCASKWGALRAATERGPRFQVWFELDAGEP
jgi:anti-anti-sigma factor